MARLSPLEFRRVLRKRATDAERELWSRSGWRSSSTGASIWLALEEIDKARGA